MFYADHLKQIYSPLALPERKYDPLATERQLYHHSAGQMKELWDAWRLADANEGAIDHTSKRTRQLEGIQAEEELVKIGRAAFDLPPFPEMLDATVLEILCDYYGWLEGKGQREPVPSK